MLEPRRYLMRLRGRYGVLGNFNGGTALADYYESFAQPQEEKTTAALNASYAAGKAAFHARRSATSGLIAAQQVTVAATEAADSNIQAAIENLRQALIEFPTVIGQPPSSEVTAARAALVSARASNSTFMSQRSQLHALFAGLLPSSEEADVLDVVAELRGRGALG